MKFFGFLFNKPELSESKEKAEKAKQLINPSNQQSSALENLPDTENKNKSRRLVDSILNVHKMNKPKH